MVIVSSSIFGKSIDVGKIYYFKSLKLVATNEPHYFIVIANPSYELLIFSCCTSQFDKRVRFIELNNLPESTLVCIKPNDTNELKKDSYIDCNNYHEFTRDELIQKYENSEIEFIGYLSDSKLEEIRQGIKDSPLIPDEIKEVI